MRRPRQHSRGEGGPGAAAAAAGPTGRRCPGGAAGERPRRFGTGAAGRGLPRRRLPGCPTRLRGAGGGAAPSPATPSQRPAPARQHHPHPPPPPAHAGSRSRPLRPRRGWRPRTAPCTSLLARRAGSGPPAAGTTPSSAPPGRGVPRSLRYGAV